MQIKKITTIFSSLILIDLFVNSDGYFYKTTPDVQENKNYLPNSINNEKEIDKSLSSIFYNNLSDRVIKLSDNVLTAIINKLPEDIVTYIFLKNTVQADMDEVISFREDFKKYPSKKFMLTAIPEREESINKISNFKYYMNLCYSSLLNYKFLSAVIFFFGSIFCYKIITYNPENQQRQGLGGDNASIHQGTDNTHSRMDNSIIFEQILQQVLAIDNSPHEGHQRANSTPGRRSPSSDGIYPLIEYISPQDQL